MELRFGELKNCLGTKEGVIWNGRKKNVGHDQVGLDNVQENYKEKRGSVQVSKVKIKVLSPIYRNRTKNGIYNISGSSSGQTKRKMEKQQENVETGLAIPTRVKKSIKVGQNQRIRVQSHREL